MSRDGTGVRADAAGFTMIELLVVVALIGIVSAMAVPLVLRARMAANESGAIGSLRAINSAQAGYAAAAASGGYAELLSVLARPCPGGSTGFVSPDLALDPSLHSGYIITLGAGSGGAGPTDCNGGTASRTGYYLTAAPISIGLSAHRAFSTTHRFVLFFNPTGVPPTEAQTLPGGGGTALQ